MKQKIEYIKGYLKALNVALASIYDDLKNGELKQYLLKVIETNKDFINEL